MTDFHENKQHKSQMMMSESLSTLVDGEASDLEARRLLKACDEHPELRQRWSRYQIVSQVLKNGQSLRAGDIDISTDLSMKIKASIANEPTIDLKQEHQSTSNTDSTRLIVNKQSGTQNLWPNIGRFAIAASVAAVVVLGVKYTPLSSQPADAVATTSSKSPLPLSEQIVYQGMADKNIVETASHSPNSGKAGIKINNQPITISSGGLKKGNHDIQQLQHRLNRLMLEHVENTSRNNHQGILPYVRIPSGEE